MITISPQSCHQRHSFWLKYAPIRSDATGGAHSASPDPTNCMVKGGGEGQEGEGMRREERGKWERKEKGREVASSEISVWLYCQISPVCTVSVSTVRSVEYRTVFY